MCGCANRLDCYNVIVYEVMEDGSEKQMGMSTVLWSKNQEEAMQKAMVWLEYLTIVEDLHELLADTIHAVRVTRCGS